MAASLEQQITRFEELLEEMRQATSDAHSAMKGLRDERRAVEALFKGDDIRKLVNERATEIVVSELSKIEPTIKRNTQAIYERIQQQVEKIVDLCLGKEYSRKSGREDMRPLLAEKLREYISEIIGLKQLLADDDSEPDSLWPDITDKDDREHFAVKVTGMPISEVVCNCKKVFVGGDVIGKQKAHMDELNAL